MEWVGIWHKVYSYIKIDGMCYSIGSLFHKKSLNMGLIFYKIIPKHGSVFPNIPKNGYLCLQN